MRYRYDKKTILPVFMIIFSGLGALFVTTLSNEHPYAIAFGPALGLIIGGIVGYLLYVFQNK
ncbi:MAG: hypothetical protein FH753_11645 [Firmicutes bacterium]|nr:hypothetical protein [Bacillota bacterium]